MKYGYRASFLAAFILMSSACVNGLTYNKEVFDKAGFTDTPKSIDEFLGIKGRFYCFGYYSVYYYMQEQGFEHFRSIRFFAIREKNQELGLPIWKKM